MEAITINETLRYMLGESWNGEPDFLWWPPDVLAVAGKLLQCSGAYTNVVQGGIKNRGTPEEWQQEMQRVGDAWRTQALEQKCPPEVVAWWQQAVGRSHLPLTRIRKTRKVWEALVKLLCAADSACAGVGVAGDASSDPFATVAAAVLRSGLRDCSPCSLCMRIDRSNLVVVPKMHTPLKGITMRSLTHHVALCDTLDVSTQWYQAFELGTEKAERRFHDSMVLLVIPEPLEINPSQFRPSTGHKTPLTNLPADFRFFEFEPGHRRAQVAQRIRALCQQTRKTVGRIDGVVLPEMALSPRDYVAVRDAIMGELSFFCTGIYQRPTRTRVGANYAQICVRMWKNSYVETRQYKHHRWFLDESQICQYGLGATLDPAKKWWENISLDHRVLNFVSLDTWLVLTVLICEDLARPDPVGGTIRAVGPNLVIALLQDGPQLAARWAARYATVLADDPGSSVLTVTSLGLSSLSRPKEGRPDPYTSRTVALWKDKAAGTQEISLPPNAQAIALSLTSIWEKEWSADGRHDDGNAGVVRLSGVHPIYLPD
jgi:hypothetical protein